MKNLIYRYFKDAFSAVSERVNSAEPYFNVFGLFLLITYPGFYLYNKYVAVTSGVDFFGLRLFIASLGIFLLCRRLYEGLWEKYKMVLWHFVIFVSLPFFFLFLLFNNPDSNIWQINGLFGLVILSVFVGPVGFFVFSIIAGIVAYFLTCFLNPGFELPSHLSPVFQTYSALILYFVIYSRKKEIVETQRQQTLKSAAGAIAHEMRTPLMSVSLVGSNVDLNVERIEKIIETNPEDKEAFQEPLKKLAHHGEGLKEIAKGANILINILLTNLKQDLDKLPQTEMSMKETLEEVLEGYSFQPHEVGMVRTDVQMDFTFRGNKELIVHIFYNLLKNSIYFVKAARKGDILITVQENKVIFKDTGTGVEKHRLKHLFTPFYSRRSHGTGIGLAFCKRAMESMGGTITVDSELNEHTTFTLTFPKV